MDYIFTETRKEAEDLNPDPVKTRSPGGHLKPNGGPRRRDSMFPYPLTPHTVTRINSENSHENVFVNIGCKELKDGLNSSSKNPSRLSSSSSEPNLFVKSEVTSPPFLQTVETGNPNMRRDSVSMIRKRSSVQMCTPKSRKKSVTQQVLSKERRNRWQISHNTPQRHKTSASQNTSLLQGRSHPDDFALWSKLLAFIPKEDQNSPHVQPSRVTITIPICTQGKDNPVMFTSFEVIEHAIRRHYADIVIKTNENDHVKDIITEETNSDTPIVGPRTRQTSGTDLIKRKTSINTCITTMRKDKTDYDQQLNGVKQVGTFAEEETLKILLAKRDAISCIIEAMKEFPEKEELQLNACNSLLKMASTSESNCLYILQNNGIPAISNTLRRHLENLSIVKVLLNTVAFISTAADLASALVVGGIHTDVLSVMSRHNGDRDVVREACFIIGNLLITVETTQELMLVGCVHTILDMANKFPDDPEIQENTCRTLGCFAAYDETCLDVALAGATQTVVKSVMPLMTSHVTVVECGCWALANLTSSEQTCEELVSLDGVQLVLSVLEQYSKEDRIQSYGIRVLCQLSECDATLHAVCSESKTQQVLQAAVVEFPENVELQEIALVTLSHIISNEGQLQNVSTLSRCGQAVVNVMLAFPENNIIQEHGCYVIGNMAVNDTLRRQVEEEGASRAVISAMLSLNTWEVIQEVGCLALMNLTADNKDNKMRIKNAGAVSALLTTLREFEHNSTVILCALKALGNLATLDEICHQVIDEKGLLTLISIVHVHKNHEEIPVLVAMILAFITYLQDLKQEAVDVIDHTLMQTLTLANNNPDVTYYVCQSIENLIKTEFGREIFINENRIEVIMNAMETFGEDRHIHKSCCTIIAVVTLYIDSFKKTITDQSVRCILTSMSLFPEDVEIQIVGCGTLACIVEKIAILKHELIGQRGLTQIQKAVKKFPNESRLSSVALLAIGHILPVDDKAFPSEAEKGFQIVLQCMSNFNENKEIQKSGCLALARCHLHRDEEIIELLTTVANTIRRHGNEVDIQKMAALAVKPYCNSEKYSAYVDITFSSTYLKTNDALRQTFGK